MAGRRLLQRPACRLSNTSRQPNSHTTATPQITAHATLSLQGLKISSCWASIKMFPILAAPRVADPRSTIHDPQGFLLLLNHRPGRRHGARGTEHGAVWGREETASLKDWRLDCSKQCLVQCQMGNEQSENMKERWAFNATEQWLSLHTYSSL